jgi:hypothetical protein
MDYPQYKELLGCPAIKAFIACTGELNRGNAFLHFQFQNWYFFIYRSNRLVNRIHPDTMIGIAQMSIDSTPV